MSRSAAEPKSRSALREISLVISFNGPSFSPPLQSSSAVAACSSLSSCLVFGAVGGRDRVEAGGVLIQIRNPARNEDDVGVADVSLILLPVGRFSSSLTGSLNRHLGVGVRI